MKKEYLYYFAFSIFLATLILLGTSLDPDMFWHINNGKTIFQNGITDINIQSYSNGYFISHSWLYDVSIFSIYQIFGYTGLKIITSLFVGASMFLIFSLLNRKKPNLLILIFIVGIYYLTIIRFLEVRPQQISLFLTIITVYLIEIKKSNPFYIFLIGILFANFHGGAIIQLLTIVVLYLLSDMIKFLLKEKTNISNFKNKFISLIAIIVSSFINPYGKEILLYPFKNLSQGIMESNIYEWFPLIDTSKDFLSKCSLFLLIFAIASMAYSKKASLENILFVSFAIMSSILYRRMYLLGTILILIFAYEHIEFSIKSIFKRITFKNLLMTRFINKKIIAIIPLIFSIMFFITSLNSINFEKNIKLSVLCPQSILNYVEDNNIDLEHNVTFNHFNMGGYLQFKGYNTFVDGRADAFLSTYGNNKPIFEDYISILEERIPIKTRNWINEYNIKYFIIYSQTIVNQSGENDSIQEYLEYSKIATTLFDDGKYAFMKVIE